MKLATEKANLASREKITIDIAANQSTKVSTDLSMSVFLLDSLESPEVEDIYSYLWLTSELKGKIQSPQYYLNSSNEDVKEAVDNLMLTHGWRRFKWESVLSDNKTPAQFIPETSDLLGSARVTNKLTGESQKTSTPFCLLQAR